MITSEDGDTVRVCVGDQIVLSGASSTAALGRMIVQWKWNDGLNEHLENDPILDLYLLEGGYYPVTLTVIDDNGCESVAGPTLPVLVSSTPRFRGSIPRAACVGMPIEMNVAPQHNAMLGVGHPQMEGPRPVFLPDRSETPMIIPLQWSTSDTSDVINDATDLGSICMEIEHSSLGDLYITLTCPSGVSVNLHQQGGGVQYLGDPVDNDNPYTGSPGTCFTYCFSADPEFGTWVQCAPGGTTPNTVTLSSGRLSLAPGTYTSIDPLSDLVGCPTNGQWTLTIWDLWAGDNGFLCNWRIGPDPDTTFIEHGPMLGSSDPDSSAWTGPNLQVDPDDPTSAFAMFEVQGEPHFTYTVFDDYGCQYDTTFTSRVFGPVVADAGPDTVICGSAIPLHGAILLPDGPFECAYTLVLTDTGADGWGNASVAVWVDGLPRSYSMQSPSPARTFEIALQSAYSIQLWYDSAANSLQNSVYLINTQGDTLFSAENGPSLGLLFSGLVDCSIPGLSTGWGPSTGLSNVLGPNADAFPTVDTEYGFSYTIPGPSGCSGTDTTLIIASSLDAVELNYEAGTDELCAPSGFSNYRWRRVTSSWTINTTPPCLNVYPPHVYHGLWTVMATDNEGCVAYCDTIVVCPTPTFTIANDRIYTNAGFDNYSWNYNGEPMVGENLRYVLPIGPGMYQVTFTTDYGCTVQGIYPHEIEIGVTSPGNVDAHMLIRPVPNVGDFTIECVGLELTDAQLLITDMTGRTILNRHLGRTPAELTLNVYLDVTPGVYFVEIGAPGQRLGQRIVVH
jgi:subtilisin-like proprotein convertase family protein